MAPNPRVAKAFRAMRDLGIIEEKVKPVLKNLLKLYDKNWELIEEENYRALADAIFEQEEVQEAEQKKKHENIDLAEMDEETHVHEEPERPLKRLRLRHQEIHILSSIGNSGPRLDGTSLKQPKVEVSELPESCVQQQSQDMTESSQSNVENATAGSHPLSSQPFTENKGKQSVLPKPLSVQERFEPSQSVVADRNQPFATEQTHSDSVCLKRKGKEPLSPQITPRDKTTISVRSSHAVRLKELKVVEPGIVLLPKHQEHNSHSLIKPKDEPLTDDMPHFEVPIAVIHPEPLSKESSSSGNGSIRKSDVPEPLAPQSVHEEDRTDGVADLSKERRTNRELANFVDESSSNLQIASSLSGEETIEVTPAVELLKQSDALDALGAGGKQFSPSSGSVDTKCAAEEALFQIPSLPPSSEGMDDCTQRNKNTAESSCEIYKENEQTGLEDENSHSLVVVQQRQQTAVNIRSLHDVNDITKGQERIVISFVNEVNKECLPSFYYIPQNVVFQNAYVNFSLAQIGENCCLTCFGDCLSSSAPCACAQESGGDFAYTFEGLVKEDFLEECISMNRDPKKQCLFHCKECPLEWSKTNEILQPCKGHLVRKFIKECWWKCPCSKQCGNRVVQRGINCNLQVFMTPEGKGWGLRTLEDLPKGAFVCEYVGEILTSAELSERISQRPTSEEHAYSVLLDADWCSEGVLKDKEALCLDALNYGNVARFINHRCFDSNLVQIPVKVETPDHHYYHNAFFTTRKVEALEELTRDYGIDFDDHNYPVKAFECHCGSKFCRKIKCLNGSGSAATGR